MIRVLKQEQSQSIMRFVFCFWKFAFGNELNAIQIDECKNIGITSLIKAFPSINQISLNFLKVLDGMEKALLMMLEILKF